MNTILIMVLSFIICIYVRSFDYISADNFEKCRFEASPSHKSFNYEERLNLITHPYPDDMK